MSSSSQWTRFGKNPTSYVGGGGGGGFDWSSLLGGGGGGLIGLAGGLLGGLFGGGHNHYLEALWDMKNRLYEQGMADHGNIDNYAQKAIASVTESYKGLADVAASNVGALWAGQNIAGVGDSNFVMDTTRAVLPMQRQLAELIANINMKIPELKAMSLTAAGQVGPSDQLAAGLDAQGQAKDDALMNSIMDITGRFTEGAKNNGAAGAGGPSKGNPATRPVTQMNPNKKKGYEGYFA